MKKTLQPKYTPAEREALYDNILMDARKGLNAEQIRQNLVNFGLNVTTTTEEIQTYLNTPEVQAYLTDPDNEELYENALYLEANKLNLKKLAQEEKPSGLVDQFGQPIPSEEKELEEEHLPVVLRERKIAPPGVSQTTTVPQPATEEQQQIWSAAQKFDTDIKAIDQLVNKAMVDMQVQVKELREKGQYTTLVAQRQQELDKLGTALDIVQNTVISFKSNILMLLQEKEPTLTMQQEYRILQKLLDRYPKLEAAFDAAKVRAQNLLLEEKGVTRELIKYPKKTEKVQPRTVTAAFLDDVQELTNILTQINSLITDLSTPV